MRSSRLSHTGLASCFTARPLVALFKVVSVNGLSSLYFTKKSRQLLELDLKIPLTESLEKKKKNNHRVADVNPTLSNYIKCKQTEHTNQKSEIGRMD